LTAFTIVIGAVMPFIAVVFIKQDMLPDFRRIVFTADWVNLLTYVFMPIAIIGLFLWRNELELAQLLWRYLLLFFGYVIAVHDFRNKKVPNGYVLAFLAAWVLITVPGMFFQIESAVQYLTDAALGATIGGGLFLLVYFISKQGLGGGDVKFIAVAGLYLGLNGVLPVILYGSVLSALTGLGLILAKRMNRKDAMPLTPFLYAGILVTVFTL